MKITDDLIARLEGTEESRELNEAIAKAVGHLPPEAEFDEYDLENGQPYYRWMTIDPDCPDVPYRTSERGLDYTASVDAALTLVPEGWWYHVSHMEVAVCPTYPIDELGLAINGAPVATNATRYDEEGRPVFYEGMIFNDRKRTARAICVAALKARAALAKAEP